MIKIKIETMFFTLAGANVILGLIKNNIPSLLGWTCAIGFAYWYSESVKENKKISQKNSKAKLK